MIGNHAVHLSRTVASVMGRAAVRATPSTAACLADAQDAWRTSRVRVQARSFARSSRSAPKKVSFAKKQQKKRCACATLGVLRCTAAYGCG